MELKKTTNNQTIAWLLLVSMFFYLLVILFLSSGTFDYGDGLSHYFISRYCWKHPLLLLDQWGKPIFTLISSPFSQFGLKALSVFNILCGLSAAYFAFKIATRLAVPLAPYVIIFTLSAPIYFSVLNSGLTEPLFSSMLVLCIWLIINKRYYDGALLFSFLPFVRAEYIFVLPVFLIFYLVKRKFLAIPLFAVGTIIYTFIGFFVFHNLLWLINQNPYSISATVGYANAPKGTLFTYIFDFKNLTGRSMGILIIAGVLWFTGGRYVYQKVRQKEQNAFLAEEFLLVFGSFFCILAAHSILWGEGIFPTLGLPRYMSTLIPLASIIALRGFQLLSAFIPDKFFILRNLILAFFAFKVLIAPYKVGWRVPFQQGPEEKVLGKAAEWLKQTPYPKDKLCYLAPYFTLAYGNDPYDVNHRTELWSMNPRHPDSNMHQGDIMIWDAHFGANEGKMNLDSLMQNPRLTLLKSFNPDVAFKVLGGKNYSVSIFIMDTTFRKSAR